MAAQINKWARHFQRPWLERAHDDRQPKWLRVSALAYGSHRANGHANFAPGEISQILASVDPKTGEIRPEDKHNVQRAIKKAIDNGWLDPRSSALCLIVPERAITGGLGSISEVCKVHERRAAAKRLSSQGESLIDSRREPR